MSWTFATLKTAIQDYTENDETSFVNNLNNFIQMAEERILKEVQFDVFRKNQTGTMSSGNKYLTKPTDILAVFSLAIKPSSGYVELLQKHPTFIDDYNPDDTVTGTPKYYANFDDTTFIIAPTPDANYTAEVHYFYRPNSLTAAAGGGTTPGQGGERGGHPGADRWRRVRRAAHRTGVDR